MGGCCWSGKALTAPRLFGIEFYAQLLKFLICSNRLLRFGISRNQPFEGLDGFSVSFELPIGESLLEVGNRALVALG